MIRRYLPLLATLVFGCAGPSESKLSLRHDYATRATAAALTRPRPAEEAVPVPPHPDLDRLERAARDRYARDRELDGLLRLPAPDLVEASRTTAGLDAWLTRPRELDELLQATWLRHPAIAARRRALRRAFEEFDQASQIEELIVRYRSFLGTSRGGPPPVPSGAVALAPYPAIEALRGELADLGADEAWQKLRGEILTRFAATRRAVAELHFQTSEIANTSRHREILDALKPAVRGRVSAGQGRQAALFELDGAIAALRTRTSDHERRRLHALRAANESLQRPIDSPLPEIAVPPVAAPPAVAALIELALRHEAGLGARRAAAGRARTAVRLGETMVLSRATWSSSRFEPERTPAFRTDPALMASPPSFGANAALLEQLRQRAREVENEVESMTGELAVRCSTAHTALEDAHDRIVLHREELIGLARSAYESRRGEFAGGGGSFTDVLRAATDLVEAERGLARAERDFETRRADLLPVVGVRTP